MDLSSISASKKAASDPGSFTQALGSVTAVRRHVTPIGESQAYAGRRGGGGVQRTHPSLGWSRIVLRTEQTGLTVLYVWPP